MRLYKLTQSDAGPEPVRTKWVGTQSDAASTRKEWVQKLGAKRDNIETEEIEVPTDKKGLIDFLNGNC
jgi:hypothetical protein